jgi:hypothetical protein
MSRYLSDFPRTSHLLWLYAPFFVFRRPSLASQDDGFLPHGADPKVLIRQAYRVVDVIQQKIQEWR